MTPSALRISADGMPALEQLVPMTAGDVLLGDERASSRGAALGRAAVILVVEFDLVAGNFGPHGPCDLGAVLAVETERLVGAGDDERGADGDRIALGDLDASELVGVAVGGPARAAAAGGVLPCRAPRARCSPPPSRCRRRGRASARRGWRSIACTSASGYFLQWCARVRSARMRGPGVSKVRGIIPAPDRRGAIVCALQRNGTAAARSGVQRRFVLSSTGSSRSIARCEPLPMRPSWRYTSAAPASPISMPPSRILGARAARRGETERQDVPTTCATCSSFPPRRSSSPSSSAESWAWESSPSGHRYGQVPSSASIDELGIAQAPTLDAAERRTVADAIVEHLATSARNKGCTRVEVAEPLASAEPSLWKRLRFASRGRTLGRTIG